MIKILFLSPTGGNAGIDNCLDNLVSNLDKAKYEPIVVFPPKANLLKKFRENGIKCYELPLKWWFHIGVTDKAVGNMLPQMGDNIEELCKIIELEDVDIVVSNTTVSFDGACAAMLTRRKHAFFMHAMFVDNIYLGLSKELKKKLYSFMGKSSERVICCSETLCGKMSALCKNTDYITNGIDVKKFNIEAHQRQRVLRMVCVGHLNANKQQDFVLKALKCLKDSAPRVLKRVHYTAIGPAEVGYLQELKSLVQKYGLEKVVTFEGFESNIPKRLKEFDVYINSSITETLPLSVMEAMASGLPALCTPNDGNCQIVRNDVDGFICDTPEIMAEKIKWMLRYPSQLEKMSKNARERIVKNFSLDAYVKKFQRTFDAINREKYTVDTAFLNDFAQWYHVLTGTCKKNKIKVLTVYPSEASATYAIAAKMPLEYLSVEGDVENKSVGLSEVTEEMVDACDLIFCIRFYTDEAYNLAKLAKGKRKAFVWYIDDNYNAISFNNGKVAHVVNKNNAYERMFAESDCTVVNNAQIYAVGNQLTEYVYHLPTYQVITKYQFTSTKPKNVIRFGFMGTLSRDGDFGEVVNAIKQVQKKYRKKIEVEFIGYCPKELKGKSGVKQFDFMYDYEEFRRFFEEREWDFALAPLSDTQFNRSKTNNKYREYASLKIPAIFSKISTYTGCVQNNVNGILVGNTKEEWAKAIETMIEDRALRERIAENAYKDIVNNYGIERYAIPLQTVFQLALARAGRRVSNGVPIVQQSSAAPAQAVSVPAAGLYRNADDLVLRQYRGRISHLTNYLKRADGSEAIRKLIPNAYLEAQIRIPHIKKCSLKVSNVIPYHGYTEYYLNGIGKNIEFFLIGKGGDSCIVELVENGKIVSQTRAYASEWNKISIPLGAINGGITLRLCVDNPNSILRTIEYFDWRRLNHKIALFGWIS